MRKTDIRYQTYLKILEEELLPAMGCTEPIAVAYAAAMARDLLGSMPVRMEVNVSGNILKNVKSVVVPNTGGLRGIQAAAAAGAAVGQAERELEDRGIPFRRNDVPNYNAGRRAYRIYVFGRDILDLKDFRQKYWRR